MDFHGFTRKELQALCKKNEIPANLTNVAMADALGGLVVVEGVEEILHSRQFEPAKTSSESLERSDLTSPYVPTGGRSTRRRNVVIQESSTVKPMHSIRRTFQRSLNEDTDGSQSEEISTPSMAQPSRKKAPLNSACRKIDSQMKKFAEEKGDVSATPAHLGLTSQRRRVNKEETTITQAYSTRRSARLAKKNGVMLNEEGHETFGLVQMDLIANYDPNMSTYMKESQEDLDEISGITGFDMETSEKEKSDEKGEAEVVSVPRLSVAHEAERLAAIRKGVDVHFDGSKSAVEETSDVEMEKPGCKIVNAAELDVNAEEIIIHPEAEAEAESEQDENIEEEMINYPEANITEYSKETSAEEVEEEGYNSHTEAARDQPTFEQSEDTEDKIIIVQQNVRIEVPENQFCHEVHISEAKIAIVSTEEINPGDHVALKDNAFDLLENAVLESGDNAEIDGVAREAGSKENEKWINIGVELDSGDVTDFYANTEIVPTNAEVHIDMVEKELISLVEPSEGSHHSTCDPLVGDLIQEDEAPTEGRNKINLAQNAELELQQTSNEVLGTKLDTRRRNVVIQESSTVKPMRSIRRTFQRSLNEDTDGSQSEEISTPSMAQPSRKKAPLNSACRKIDSQMKKFAEEKGDVSVTPAHLGLTSQRRRVNKEETTITQAYSTRRSARLAKKNGVMLNEEGHETFGLVQMDLIANYDPNMSTCMKESQEDLDEISGITGFDMETSEKEKSDEKGEAEVVSVPRQDLSVAHEAERLAAIRKGVDVHFNGSKSAVEETSDVEMEKTGCKIVNVAELDVNNAEEIIIHLEAEAESEYPKDENIEEMINYPEANITEYSKETSAEEVEEDGYNSHTEAARDQPTFEQSEDNKIIIVQQNVRIEVPENQYNAEIDGVAREAGSKENEKWINIGVELDSGDVTDFYANTEIVPTNAEVHIDMVEKELISLVEPSEGSHHSTCDPLVGDLIQEEAAPTEGRNKINLAQNAELEPQQTSNEVLGTKLDTGDTEVESTVVTPLKNSVGDVLVEGQSPHFAPKETNATSVELCYQKSPVVTGLDKHQFFKPARSTPNRDSASKKMSSVLSDDKENIGSGSKLILTKEKPNMAKSSNAENAQGFLSFSKRKLTKMLKNKLEMSKNENENNETPVRTALQALSENR